MKITIQFEGTLSELAAYMQESNIPVTTPLTASFSVTKADQVNDLLNPSRPQAIKLLRTVAGIGLKEAKDFVENRVAAVKLF